MTAMLYFAYGSNLDEAQMRARCPGARRVARAVLPRHALHFGNWSERWQGSVASVRRASNSDVEGLLYELNVDDLAQLDRIEGHPWFYERVVRQVLDEHGRRRRAHVYQLTDPEDGPPSCDYLGVIQRAYQRLGFEDATLLRAALPGPPLRRIFVYGTLLAGESNHRLLRTARLLGRARTEASWTMVSLGGFPGVHAGGETVIVGEVYEVDTATLAELDRLEGHPSFYRRTPLRLEGHDDVETYLLTSAQVEGCLPIPSGCWRTHRKETKR